KRLDISEEYFPYPAFLLLYLMPVNGVFHAPMSRRGLGLGLAPAPALWRPGRECRPLILPIPITSAFPARCLVNCRRPILVALVQTVRRMFLRNRLSRETLG